MSNEASCIKDHIDSNLLRDEMPSAPYQNGGYLTANMVNSLTYLISRIESAIVSTGFTLNRYTADYKKVTNSALQAIKELEALVEQKWHSYEDFDQLDEEYQARSSNNSVEDDEC
ncbi:hypothetical protein Tco_0517447 [Tanacetum coccineum]